MDVPLRRLNAAVVPGRRDRGQDVLAGCEEVGLEQVATRGARGPREENAAP